MHPLQQVSRDGQEDARDRHGEEHHERQEIVSELLHRERTTVAAPAPHGHRHARDHQRRGDIEDVEHERREWAVEIEREHVDAKHERLVPLERGAGRFKVHPPERQRKGDRRGEHAAPGEAPVCGPAQRRSFLDEALRDDVHGEERREAGEVLRDARGREEQTPAAPPVEARGRLREPHGIAIAEAERREHARTCVRDQRRVEVPEPSAADIDAREDERGNQEAPSHGAGDIGAAGCRHAASIGQSQRDGCPDVASRSKRLTCRKKEAPIFRSRSGPAVCAIIVVPGAGHNESLRGEVWSEVERWLDGVVPGAASEGPAGTTTSR